MNFKRFYHTSKIIFNKNINYSPRKPRRRWLKWASVLTVSIGGLYLGDMIINDDLDAIRDRFRTKLSEEERKNRYKFVISEFFRF